MGEEKEIFTTNSFEETQKLGGEFVRRFAKRSLLREGDSLAKIIALYGDLGSGKTTFVQGMAKGLGIKRRIISPTFIIIRSYKIDIKYDPFGKLRTRISNMKNTLRLRDAPSGASLRSGQANKKFKTFYHIDLYRIESKKGIEGLGIEEIINDPQNIAAIEWAERMGDLLSRKRWDVSFDNVGGDKRRIIVVSS